MHVTAMLIHIEIQNFDAQDVQFLGLLSIWLSELNFVLTVLTEVFNQK